MDHGDWGTGTQDRVDALRVIVAGDDAAALAATSKAVGIVGGRVAAEVPLDEIGARLGEQIAIDLLMLELSGASPHAVDGAIDQMLTSELCFHMEDEGDGVPVIAAIDIAQIDAVSARLHGRNVQLLCAPSLAERTAAIVHVRESRGGAALSDLTRESEYERLKRLDEDVARIADALARLTGRDSTGAHGGNGRPGGAGFHEAPLRHGVPPAVPATNDLALAGKVRSAIKARRMRDQFFQPALFADPAWDMLLDLFAARLEHARVSVSSLCIAAAVPPTTALRWISTLSEAGLIEREADPLDKRRAFIGLSEGASAGMQGYVSAMERAGLAMG